MIYLDHAATSWPKPASVIKAMSDFLEFSGGNPGRSGHCLSIAAGRVIYQTREKVAEFFHASDPLRVIFTLNTTHAINLALHGFLKPGSRVVTGSVEHNAVMRPLRELEKRGVLVEVVPCAPDGLLDTAAFGRAVQKGIDLAVINHASNVVGSIAPVAEISALVKAAGGLLLVDAAQTSGFLPIDMQQMGIDILAFSGHKGLHGPPGTGGLIIGDRVDPGRIAPLLQGGTGSRSEFEIQPDFLPDKFECGTPNGVGIAGLGAGIAWIRERGVDAIRGHELELTGMIIRGLESIPGVRVYGPNGLSRRTGVVSFTVDGFSLSDIGLRLDEEAGVLCRVGLHCAPAAHRTIGTFPDGTIRFAPGPLTTRDEIDQAIRALERIVRS